MKSSIAGLVAALLLTGCSDRDELAEPAAVGKTESVTSPSSRIFDMPYLMRDLDNGLRVIIVETDYPDIVTMHIPVQTGSRNEVEAGKTGFAHFFEHMMFRGTEKYPSEAYTAIRKKAGADSNAFTTDDYTNYYMTFTRPDLEKMIEVEADRFQNLSYSESDFRTEALAIMGEYLKDYSNPILKAFERTRSLSFREHPYGHTTIGLIEDIEAMPDQLGYSREFFDRWYRPEYTSVIIVGDVDAETTFELVDRYWGDWEPGSYVADIPQEPEGTGPVYEHIRWEGDTQPWLFIGFRSPAFNPADNDYAAMGVLNSVYFSDSSDLYQALVIERQWVDQLLTDFPLNKDPNLNLVYIRLTDEAHAADVERAVLDTLARARTELIDAGRLEQTKRRARYSFAASLDNADAIGSMLADYVQVDRTPETVNALYDRLDELTAGDIRRIASEYFTDQTRVTVSLSGSSSIAGVGTTVSVDALAAARPMAETAAPLQPKEGGSVREEVFAASGESAPLSIVAQPSSTSALVDVSILVHAGAAMDPPGQKGLAMLTAAMLTEAGSATWSIQDINDAMYPIASGFSAQVDKEMTRLSGQVHKDNLDTWYRYVRSQFLNPGWDAQDFERVKTQRVNAVRSGLVGNNDEELGKEVLYEQIYGAGHPYGSLNLGHSGDIEKLTLEDVKGFYETYYTVNNMTVGVSGGYPDTFVTRLGNDLQSLPAGERAAIEIPVAERSEGNRVTIVEKETPAVAVSFGFPIDLKRGDPDWIALWLARSWLGEHRSENGRLYQQIRGERGLNYGDYAYIEYFPSGMYQMHPDTNLGRQHQVFQVWIRPLGSNSEAHFATRAAVHEIGKLIDEGMSETDFEATRAFLSKFVSLITDGQSRQLGYAMDSRYYGIGNFTEYVREGLEALTLADVNRVIRENLRTNDMNYVFVTRDAMDLRERLGSEAPSPLTYDAEKPAALLEEDKVIESLRLNIAQDAIEIVPADVIFH